MARYGSHQAAGADAGAIWSSALRIGLVPLTRASTMAGSVVGSRLGHDFRRQPAGGADAGGKEGMLHGKVFGLVQRVGLRSRVRHRGIGGRLSFVGT